MSDKSILYDILSLVELKEKSAQSNLQGAEHSIRYCKSNMSNNPPRYKIRIEEEERRAIKWSGEVARFTGQAELLRKLIRKMK